MTKKILLDVDGVLIDFVAGAARVHGKDPSTVKNYHFWPEWGLSDDEFWSPLAFDFWANLDPYPEAQELLQICTEAVGKDNILLVTSPCNTVGCLEGKKASLAKHFSGYHSSFMSPKARCLMAHKEMLLIDDNVETCGKFHGAGGNTIKYPRPWNTWKAWNGCKTFGIELTPKVEWLVSLWLEGKKLESY